MRGPGIERWLAPAALSVALLLSGALAFLSMRGDSATDDEPAHIVAGYLEVFQGRFDLFREQPPLIDSLSALPLVGHGYTLPAGWDAEGANPWRLGGAFLYHSGNDADGILLRARLPILLLFLLLSLIVYRFALELTGSRAAAFVSFALTAFCPNLMAHGRLATVDLGAAFFCTLSALAYLLFLRSPTTPRACLSGASFGLAVLTKVSSLVVVPWAGIVGVLFLIGERRRWEERAAAALPRMLLLVAVGIATFEAVYLAEMRTLDLAAPFAEYGKSVSAVFRWVVGPYPKPQFLLGSFSATGWWYYYPVALLLKTPIPSLLLIAISLVVLARRNAEKRLEISALLLFVGILLGAACASPLNIGLRYALPVYPFLYVLVGVAAWKASSGGWRRSLAGGMALLACGSVVCGVAAFPSYLSYFNETVKREEADRYLIDSNLDWGQDLRRLARWADENRVPVVHTLYFGGSEPSYYLGERARILASCEATEPGIYAISRHLFRSLAGCEERFRDARRVTTIGGSILVFEVTRP